ncbi:MAG: hypothetical protein ABI867_32470 [Kofleriaceae bacterium]
MNSIFAALAVPVMLASSCASPPRPDVGPPQQTSRVLGVPLTISASWSGSCRDWGATLHALSRDHSEISTTRWCNEQDFEVHVECSAPCTPPAPRTNRGWIELKVIPLQLGPLAITVTNMRRDTGEVYRVTLPTVAIVPPDRLELHCMTDQRGYGHREVACGPDGVPASAPHVRALVQYGGRAEHSTLLRINGTTQGDDGWVSLADLNPGARAGEGVVPGTYSITLELATKVERWQVVAR